jgi:hypothetical protein
VVSVYRDNRALLTAINEVSAYDLVVRQAWSAQQKRFAEGTIVRLRQDQDQCRGGRGEVTADELDERPAIGAVLQPAGEGHSWPPVLPPARFGDAGSVRYTRVGPQLGDVVEPSTHLSPPPRRN